MHGYRCICVYPQPFPHHPASSGVAFSVPLIVPVPQPDPMLHGILLGAEL